MIKQAFVTWAVFVFMNLVLGLISLAGLATIGYFLGQ